VKRAYNGFHHRKASTVPKKFMVFGEEWKQNKSCITRNQVLLGRVAYEFDEKLSHRLLSYGDIDIGLQHFFAA
jgi:hypothetical protein